MNNESILDKTKIGNQSQTADEQKGLISNS
jgi:hypothetical protein